MVTEDKARVLDILLNMIIKLAVAGSCIAAFWFILLKVLPETPDTRIWPFAFLESVLGGTMYVIVAHYFPAWKAATKSPPTKRAKSNPT